MENATLRTKARWPGLVLAAALSACSSETQAPPGAVQDVRFESVTLESGFDFIHRNGATGRFYFPELMQAGVGFVDFDNDGFLDVYLVQSGPLPLRIEPEDGANQLYRNRRDGTFERVPDTAGAADRGYGVGLAAADYDNDGDVDIYVTNLGRNTLLRNEGNGSFTDVTDDAGVGDPGYSSSALFADVDADGDLDLYVCNYVAWSPEIERACYARNGLRDYCSPATYKRPQPDTLYLNASDGTFREVSRESGIRAATGTGLGVVGADFDDDGDVDIYVANDQMSNFLWINDGAGHFRDEALVRGCALNEAGRAEAGMGVAVDDADADGDWDLFVVHLDGETNTYYRNRGGQFDDVTDLLRLGSVSRPYTGFGVGSHDFDCDGWSDLFVANGRVRMGDTMEAGAYGERNQLLRGTADGLFRELPRFGGADDEAQQVSRSAAFGDYDNDGDVDILIGNNGGAVRLLRNESCADRAWLTVEVGGGLGRDAIGATVEVEAAGRRWRRRVQRAYSYAASNDPRVHIGLGDIERVDRILVTWPDSEQRELRNVEVRRQIRIDRNARR